MSILILRAIAKKTTEEPVKYCPSCLKFNVRAGVEWHKNTQLNFCSYHYWLMRGRDAGGGTYSLEAYIEASKLHGFRTSLPSPEEMARMSADRLVV